MSYPPRHETTNLRAFDLGRRARVPGGRLALAGCFRPPPVPNTSPQLQGRERLPDRPQPRLQPPERARNAIHLFNESGLQAALSRGSSRPHTIHAAFDSEGAERLRELLHQNPRRFGKDSSLWTLQMAAEVSFEEGITEERVTRARLSAPLW